MKKLSMILLLFIVAVSAQADTFFVGTNNSGGVVANGVAQTTVEANLRGAAANSPGETFTLHQGTQFVSQPTTPTETDIDSTVATWLVFNQFTGQVEASGLADELTAIAQAVALAETAGNQGRTFVVLRSFRTYVVSTGAVVTAAD